jgi:hypothetical protein
METLEKKAGYEAGLTEYVDRERSAVDLLNSVGQLMYGKAWNWCSSATTCWTSTPEVIKLFNYAETVVKKPIDVVQMRRRGARPAGTWTWPRARSTWGKLTHEFGNSGKRVAGSMISSKTLERLHRTGQAQVQARRTWCSTASGASAASPRVNW